MQAGILFSFMNEKNSFVSGAGELPSFKTPSRSIRRGLIFHFHLKKKGGFYAALVSYNFDSANTGNLIFAK